MRDRFSKAIGKWYMTSFSIEEVGYSEYVAASVFAELIDLITMQDIHPEDGLNEIIFSDFWKVGELDEGVLDQLIPLSKRLTKLTVNKIYKTSRENKQALVLMTEKILNLRPPLTHLDFREFFFYKASEETLQQGERLLQALASITQPSLLSLNMGANSILWKDEARFNLLLEVLQQQSSL